MTVIQHCCRGPKPYSQSGERVSWKGGGKVRRRLETMRSYKRVTGEGAAGQRRRQRAGYADMIGSSSTGCLQKVKRKRPLTQVQHLERERAWRRRLWRKTMNPTERPRRQFKEITRHAHRLLANMAQQQRGPISLNLWTWHEPLPITTGVSRIRGADSKLTQEIRKE